MNKSQLIVSAIVLAFLPSAALAGALNANLHCQGEKAGSKVLLSGSIPGDLPEFGINLQYKEKNLIVESDQGRINTVTAFSKGVFVVTVALKNGSDLQLYALPKSISYKGSHSTGNIKASFKAILSEAPEPFGPTLNDTELTCSYGYVL